MDSVFDTRRHNPKTSLSSGWGGVLFFLNQLLKPLLRADLERFYRLLEPGLISSRELGLRLGPLRRHLWPQQAGPVRQRSCGTPGSGTAQPVE